MTQLKDSMNNIEKIRQEIERRKKSLRAGICNDEAFTRKQKEEMRVALAELTRLSRFIDSLPEEGFATEGIRIIPGDDGFRDHYNDITRPVHISYRDVKDLSQRLEVVDSLPEDEPSKDLKEAAKEYIRKDALMEWINAQQEKLWELLPDADNDNPTQMELRHLGQYMQLEALEDKLNEM